MIQRYMRETIYVLDRIDRGPIEDVVVQLKNLQRREGRLFLVGVGGSAATASHAAGDFRKFAGIEAYCAVDNVPELTATTNDEAWEWSLARWLERSRLRDSDVLMVVSVGGGSADASPNIVRAVDYARDAHAVVLGIVGRDGGYTAAHGKAVIVIPPLYADRVTFHTEGIASVLVHLLVNEVMER